jgi:hypothetical protein
MEGRPTNFLSFFFLFQLESPFKPKAKPRFADSEKKQLKSCQQMEGRPTFEAKLKKASERGRIPCQPVMSKNV